MVHVDQLLVGMGYLWLILQNECVRYGPNSSISFPYFCFGKGCDLPPRCLVYMLYSTMGRRVAANVYSKEKQSKRDKEGALECFHIKCKTPKVLKECCAETEKHARQPLANQLNKKKDYIVHGIKTFMVWITEAL